MTRAVTLANLAVSDLLTVDSDTSRVGIGSTIPKTKLDVAGIVSATSYQGDGSNLTGILLVQLYQQDQDHRELY